VAARHDGNGRLIASGSPRQPEPLATVVMIAWDLAGMLRSLQR
jgi:hypothetical protein